MIWYKPNYHTINQYIILQKNNTHLSVIVI